MEGEGLTLKEVSKITSNFFKNSACYNFSSSDPFSSTHQPTYWSMSAYHGILSRDLAGLLSILQQNED